MNYELVEYLEKHLVDYKIKSAIDKVVSTLYYLSIRDPIEAIKREDTCFLHPNSFRIIRKLQQNYSHLFNDNIMFIFALRNYSMIRVKQNYKSGEILPTESKSFHTFAEAVSNFIKLHADIDIINMVIKNVHNNINSQYDDKIKYIKHDKLIVMLYQDLIQFVTIPCDIIQIKNTMNKLFNDKEYYT